MFAERIFFILQKKILNILNLFEYSFIVIIEAKKNTAESDALLASASNFQDK